MAEECGNVRCAAPLSAQGDEPERTPMAGKPWYHKGLQFECSQCGDCCTGAPGFVWVNQEEIAAIAAVIGMADLDEFERKYVRRVGVRRSLVEFPDGACVFFDTVARKCTVYDGRPRQCRTWPFWDSNLETPADWQHTCEVCPGSGQGKLHSLETIEEQRKVMKV
jgi:Fe-S-cluster containining protein